jgi:hypothetical protein
VKIFISYSTTDLALVRSIVAHISAPDQVFYWDKDKEPGKESWPTIFGWIDQADLVLVLITDSTVKRAMAVGQEVGHATKAKKRIIPLVAPGIPDDELGCLKGITYQPFDPSHPVPSLGQVRGLVANRGKEMQEEQKTALWIVGGIAALLWFSSKE